ncbi:MAG: hypothetical protein WAT67_15285 [Candidatus Contendobacter sp.]
MIPRLPFLLDLGNFGPQGGGVVDVYAFLPGDLRALGRALHRSQPFRQLPLFPPSNSRHLLGFFQRRIIEAKQVSRCFGCPAFRGQAIYRLDQVNRVIGVFSALDSLNAYRLEALVTGGGGADADGGIVGELIGTMSGNEALSAVICDGVSPCSCRTRQ